jgi:hypothetical protein
MPRFYIHFRVSDQIAKDDVGIELPSLEEARETALLSAREIVADDVKTNSKNPLQAVIIEGESGQDLLTILREGCLARAIPRRTSRATTKSHPVSWREMGVRGMLVYCGHVGDTAAIHS